MAKDHHVTSADDGVVGVQCIHAKAGDWWSLWAGDVERCMHCGMKLRVIWDVRLMEVSDEAQQAWSDAGTKSAGTHGGG